MHLEIAAIVGERGPGQRRVGSAAAHLGAAQEVRAQGAARVRPRRALAAGIDRRFTIGDAGPQHLLDHARRRRADPRDPERPVRLDVALDRLVEVEDGRGRPLVSPLALRGRLHWRNRAAATRSPIVVQRAGHAPQVANATPWYGRGVSADVSIRPAATVIVMRDAPAGPEVFLVRRHHAFAFMAGAHVFPGGRVDEADRDAAAEWCDHGGRPEAALSPPPASFIAAARELFEEAGVLLARDRHGAFVSFAAAAGQARFESYRDDVHQGRQSLQSIVEGEGLRLALDALVPYALWVTPPNEVRRFDTWFFLARVPPEQRPAHEHTESTDSTWIAPAEALARAVSGEMLLPPQPGSRLWSWSASPRLAPRWSGPPAGSFIVASRRCWRE